jgi:hypothetical protein
VELLHLAVWRGRYMTCMKDWWAFSFSCTICPCSVSSVVRHLLLTLDFDSYFAFSLTPEALFATPSRP